MASSKPATEILLGDKYKKFLLKIVSKTDLSIFESRPDLLEGGFHEKIQASINKYSKINNIFQNYKVYIDNILKKIFYNNIIHKILLENKEEGKINYDFCIGGSIAWNRLFKEFYDHPNLMSEYEKSAIHDTSMHSYNYIKSNTNDFKSTIEKIYTELNNKIELLNNLFKDPNERLQQEIIKAYQDEIDNIIKYKEGKEKKLTSIGNVSSTTKLKLRKEIEALTEKIDQKRIENERKISEINEMFRSKKETLEGIKQEKIQFQLKINKHMVFEQQPASEIERIMNATNILSIDITFGNTEIFEEKTSTELLYLHFFNIAMDNKNIPKLCNITDKGYLNIYGLFIYNYLRKTNRASVKDSYDIYNVRDEIFRKYLLTDDKIKIKTKEQAEKDDREAMQAEGDKVEEEEIIIDDNVPKFINSKKLYIIYLIIENYKKTFKITNVHFLYNNYFEKNIKKIFFDESDYLKIFDNILRYFLIERFRPYINFIIKLINQDLKNADFDPLFIVGGDACRRYKNDISRTEDIDAKLYLEKDKDNDAHKEAFDTVEKIIVKRVNQLIAYFIVNREKILNKHMTKLDEYLIENKYDNNFITYDENNNLIYTYYDDDKKIRHQVTYFLNDKRSTYFRFRHNISSGFPVDLYASDFQIKTHYKVDQMIETPRDIIFLKNLYEDQELTFDMAYLDISVDTLKEKEIIEDMDVPDDKMQEDSQIFQTMPVIHKYKTKEYILPMADKYILSNNLEVASLKFLINDLRSTYNSDSSISRLINGKNKKDYLRYLELVNIYKTYLFTQDDNKILNETDFSELLQFKDFKDDKDEEQKMILDEQAKNKIEREKLDIIEDIISDIETPNTLIYFYYTVLIDNYNIKRQKNEFKIKLNFNKDELDNKASKIMPSKRTQAQIARDQQARDQQGQSQKRAKSAYGGSGSKFIKLTIKFLLEIEKEKEKNELKKLLENEEFKSSYKLMNKEKLLNKINDLFKNINFNTNECKIETNDIIPPF